ncbi:esterase-like activity of phytase family protein [Coraliomargarita sp. W4R53]
MQTVPTETVVDEVEIGGLSGIFYDPYTDTFTAISDDSRSAGASRMWNIELDYDATSFSAVTVNSSTSLKTPAGDETWAMDAEGIAGNLDGTFYISNEGVASGSSPNIPPWIWRFDATTGIKRGEVTLPGKFWPRDVEGGAVRPGNAAQTSGVRSNLSLESLGITPSRNTLFSANEAALTQDYSGSYDGEFNQAQNSRIRIMRFTEMPRNIMAAEEKVYQADLGTNFIFLRLFNTVADILPVDDNGRMLVLERGLTKSNTDLGSYRIRLYEVDYNQTGATNVSDTESLIGATYTQLTKSRIWQSDSNMDNVEALCFGRDIDGFRTIVLASDNNFSTDQITQFHVLLTDIPAVPRRTLDTNVLGGGSIAVVPSVAWYPEGRDVSLTAKEDTNYTFGDWTGDVAGTSTVQELTMDASKTVTARFLSPFQAWGSSYFTAEEIWAPDWATTDSDSDGLSNQLEYALNLQPLQPSTIGLPTVGLSGGNLTLEYQKDRSKSDISYQVQASPDLKDWSPYSDVLISTNGTIETRQASLPMDGSLHFLRLKITTLFGAD